ncbi:hypothetical protein BC937DRAFT_93515 [Endogone sp. FLAS-F59071]|nr:hypothetical protein BC937DRAFT_93515 [Endogone sp. FLAS-F59071]|eukprot:RUS14645.1 hypothetical protein BC937DRAFT_93515 [Endogone sp. FLAS-F59071]
MFSTSKAWRILVAEDNEVNKKFLSRMQWADTAIVSDGVEAMGEYERSSFDIVFARPEHATYERRRGHAGHQREG